MPNALDLTGQRFGFLTALERVPSHSGKTYWKCQCDCGNIKDIQTNHLRQGKIKSCGICNSIEKHTTIFTIVCPICHQKFDSNNASRKYCYDCSPIGRKGDYTPLIHAMKRQIIKERGGKCEICGYNKCEDALCFHHIDPKTKEFQLSTQSGSCSWEKYKTEANKCMLLCLNCHAEIHKEIRTQDI